MKNIILATIIILGTVTTASAQDNAKDCLPDCSNAKVMIFNGASFDGTVYLHDTDVQLSTHQVKAVKAIAAQGKQPVVCMDAEVVIVTANN